MQFHRRYKAPRIVDRTWKANAFGPYTRQRFYRSLLWGPQSPDCQIHFFAYRDCIPRRKYIGSCTLVHVLDHQTSRLWMSPSRNKEVFRTGFKLTFNRNRFMMRNRSLAHGPCQRSIRRFRSVHGETPINSTQIPRMFSKIRGTSRRFHRG